MTDKIREFASSVYDGITGVYNKAVNKMPEAPAGLSKPSGGLFSSILSSPVPPFSSTKPRYDLSKFTGRLRYRYEVCDPRTLLVTTSQLAEAQRMLAAFKEQKKLPQGCTDSDLWEARRIEEAVTNCDSGEVINPAFRFSAFGPMNIFIVTAMLAPSTIRSPYRTVGIHWFNQSYNVAVNHANRNASKPVSNAAVAQGYAAACGSSMSIALGATFLLRRIQGNTSIAATAVRAVVPFLAIITAGCANLSLIRYSDWNEGIDVYDEEGTKRGMSLLAGQRAILECCGSRILWNIPIMLCPPFIMQRLYQTSILRRFPSLKMPTEVAVIVAFLMAGVPPALAAFPEYENMAAADLEEEFRDLRDSKGNKIVGSSFDQCFVSQR